jgi:two-component system, cell cycle response regulator DivK
MVTEAPARPLVLVVDDYEDAREMYAECLDASGFEVAQAESGDEAVAKALALQPALIVMDLALPGMDGWSATRAIKTDARTSAIPVVALTGHARSDASAAARDAGCDAFLTKPCLPDAVVEIVRRLLASRHVTLSADTAGSNT